MDLVHHNIYASRVTTGCCWCRELFALMPMTTSTTATLAADVWASNGSVVVVHNIYIIFLSLLFYLVFLCFLHFVSPIPKKTTETTNAPTVRFSFSFGDPFACGAHAFVNYVHGSSIPLKLSCGFCCLLRLIHLTGRINPHRTAQNTQQRIEHTVRPCHSVVLHTLFIWFLWDVEVVVWASIWASGQPELNHESIQTHLF